MRQLAIHAKLNNLFENPFDRGLVIEQSPGRASGGIRLKCCLCEWEESKISGSWVEMEGHFKECHVEIFTLWGLQQ